jgi:beta-fructofuranosidase
VAREKAGPGRNRGCVALTASRDLVHWGTRQPFWSPSLYYTHECPDLFRVGDWHYLVYSEFSDRSMTRYRMSRSLKGPWIAPPNDSFDGRAYYAAKTAGDGQRRFVFGWLPTRGGDKDDGGWQWGGHLVVHQVVQRRDGTLAVRVPRTILDAFQRRLPLSPQPVLGTWTVQGDYFRADATDRFSALLLGELPCECLIEADISFSKPTAGCGLLFRSDAELNSYYQLRLEPHANRVVFDRWPRPGDQPFVIERPFVARPGNFVHFRVLLDGTCLVAYLDDEIALSCRMYDHPKGQLGVFVSESQARFDRVSIKARR